MLHSLSSCPSLWGTDIHRHIPDCWITNIDWYNSVFSSSSLLLLMYDRQVGKWADRWCKDEALSIFTWNLTQSCYGCRRYNYLCLVSNVSSPGPSTLFTLQLCLALCHTSDWTVEKCCSAWTSVCVNVCLLISQSFSEVVWMPECLFG